VGLAIQDNKEKPEKFCHIVLIDPWQMPKTTGVKYIQQCLTKWPDGHQRAPVARCANNEGQGAAEALFLDYLDFHRLLAGRAAQCKTYCDGYIHQLDCGFLAPVSLTRL